MIRGNMSDGNGGKKGGENLADIRDIEKNCIEGEPVSRKTEKLPLSTISDTTEGSLNGCACLFVEAK